MARAFPALLIVGLVIAFDVSAAAVGQAPLSLQIDASDSSTITLSDVAYEPINGGLTVHGYAAKPWYHRGLIPGHVDILFVDGKGRVVMQRQAPLYGFEPSTRNPDHASFSARFYAIPGATQAIRLRYRNPISFWQLVGWL
jgi:hypothetical protein